MDRRPFIFFIYIFRLFGVKWSINKKMVSSNNRELTSHIKYTVHIWSGVKQYIGSNQYGTSAVWCCHNVNKWTRKQCIILFLHGDQCFEIVCWRSCSIQLFLVTRIFVKINGFCLGFNSLYLGLHTFYRKAVLTRNRKYGALYKYII